MYANIEETDSETTIEQPSRWTRPLTVKLIRLLRESESESIYNTKHSLYGNRRKRTEKILKIYMELKALDPSVTVDAIRIKIRGIRAQYVAEFRRIQSIKAAGGTAEMCVPTLWFFDEMAIMHAYFNTQPLEPNQNTSSNKTSSILDDSDDDDNNQQKTGKRKTIFTRPLVRKLISLLRQNESSYKVTHPDYQNKRKRYALLQKMCNELNKLNESVTVEAIKIKIAGLRKQYQDETRRIQALSSSDTEVSRLWCYDQLEFFANSRVEETTNIPHEEVLIEVVESLEEEAAAAATVKEPCVTKIREIELCRLCADLTKLTDLEDLFEHEQENLLEQIAELTGLQLRNTHNLPKYICTSCKEQTLLAHKFRERCIQAQEHLDTISPSVAYSSDAIQMELLEKETSLNEEYLINTSDQDEENTHLYGYEYEVVEDNDDRSMTFHEVLLKEDDNSNSHNGDTTNSNLNNSHDNYTMTLEVMPVIIEPPHKDSVMAENIKISDYAEKSILEANENSTSSSSSGGGGGVKSRQKKTLMKRTLKKSSSFICDQCGKRFTNRSGLRVHEKRHLAVKEFQCDHCPKAFSCKSELQLHRRIHTGETPYPCGYCELRFRSCTKRVMHERRYHTNDKPFACDQCDRRFTNSSEYHSHRTRHTGIRPHECFICNTAFHEKKHLKVHCLSLAHKKKEERQRAYENSTDFILQEENNYDAVHLL